MNRLNITCASLLALTLTTTAAFAATCGDTGAGFEGWKTDETYSGEYWSVQSKYQTNSDRPLNFKKLSTFFSLSFVTAKGISTGLVVHTSTKKVKKSHLIGNTVELGLQHWLEISEGQWDQILDLCRGNILQPPEKRKKRKHQELGLIMLRATNNR
ncbi:hypothetical protein OAD38_07105 [Ascidiaceihabitans sp.]|nr:hypothetical protein [Paracoccaceae bacterium]MDB9946126.1 hypothetical protein [Ascidiaceihabitans sp.]